MNLPWTELEQTTLKQNIHLSVKEIRNLLPNRTLSSIENRKNYLNLKSGIYKKYTLDVSFFETYNLASAYWAGFLAADGTIRDKQKQICLVLQNRDKVHVEKFATDIQFNGPVYTRNLKRKFKPNEPEKTYMSSGLSLCGASKLIDDLWKNYNVGPRKSLILKPPTQITNVDIKHAFLIGYIDGDGTIGLSKDQKLELDVIGTKEIVTWAKDLIDVIVPVITNFDGQVNKEKKNSKIFRYKVTGFRALKILRFLNSIDVPRLARKWDKISLAREPIYKNDYLDTDIVVKRKPRNI